MGGISAFIIQELPTHSGHIKAGIVLHQEEPMAQCTCLRSDHDAENLNQNPLLTKAQMPSGRFHLNSTNKL